MNAAGINERYQRLEDVRLDVVQGNARLVRFNEAGGFKKCVKVGRVKGEDELVTGNTDVPRHQDHICQLLPNTEIFQLGPSIHQSHHHSDPDLHLKTETIINKYNLIY